MTVIGDETVQVEQDDKAVFRMTQAVAEIALDGDEIGMVMTSFPVPFILVFRKKGEPDHVVELTPLIYKVAERIGWKQTEAVVMAEGGKGGASKPSDDYGGAEINPKIEVK